MKMVKSLLLSSAAGLVAVAGAQAADLPVKAKPVEYVKVCSLYGAGFYYIPGTDTCLKVGGMVRFDTNINGSLSGAQVWFSGADARFNDAETREYRWRTRTQWSLDTRSQTEYGTLRSYARIGMQYTTGDETADGLIYFDRAFVQFAGFTFGKSVSFMDFWSANGVANASLVGGSDSTNGINLAAYTLQLGNGLSATIALEDSHFYGRSGVFNANNTTALTLGTAAPSSYGSYELPDIAATLRLDQAWGSAQIGAVAHQVLPAFYGTTTTGLWSNGGPGDEWGYAVMAGLEIKFPQLGAGDRFIGQVTFAEGAIMRLNPGALGGNSRATVPTYGIYTNEVTASYIADAVFATGTGLNLTQGWAIIGGYEHFWRPNLRTSIFADYSEINYNAAANAILCARVFAPGAAGIGTLTAGSTCNQDTQVFQIGSRTVWNPVRNLDVGVEVIYTKVEVDNSGSAVINTVGAMPTGTYAFGDYDVVTFNARVQRNFWP